MIEINAKTCIPQEEIWFTYASSPGPGGQHVNRTRTQAILHFDLDASNSLSDAEKSRVRQRLASRIDSSGILMIRAHASRSQHANREAALSRFAELLQNALKPAKRRRKTKPSRTSVEKRLQKKQNRSLLKKSRKKPRDW